MRLLSTTVVVIFLDASAFTPERKTFNTALFSSVPSDVSSSSSSTLDDLKADLVRACTRTDMPNQKTEIKELVRDLEEKAESVGEGQSSSITGLMSGRCFFFCRSSKME